MSESNQLAVAAPVRASDQLASFLGIEKGMMLDTLKAQCFKGKRPDEVSDAQLAAFVSTANALQVNPLMPGFLYAYPERNGGITPILGPDGVMKKLDEMIVSGKLKGYKCDVKMGADGKPESATAVIHRGEGQVPAEYTAYFSEWCVTSNPNWQSRPRHMIWVRAIKQAARQVIHGLPMDADEYEIQQMQNVTPTDAQPTQPRPTAPKRAAKGAAAVKENAQPTSAPATIIEAEVTPVASDNGTGATAVSVPAEVIVETSAATSPKVETFTQAAEAAKSAPRTSLNDAEEITAECEVVAVDPMIITATVNGVKAPQPSVQVRLKGGYEGVAYHICGGVKDGDAVKPGPAWAVGSAVVVKLRGKMNAKVGKMQVFVDAVEASGMEA